MTGALLALVVAAYLGIGAVELPPLWRRRERRREAWAVIGLLLLGLVWAATVVLGYRPISAFWLIEAVFKPVGTLLFKAKGA